MGCDWDGAKQMLVLCDTLWHPWVMVQVICAWLSPLMCAALQTRASCIDSNRKRSCFLWIQLKFQAFPSEAVTSSGGMWELGFGRAAGCWQFAWLLMATARAQILRIDPVFVLGETADKDVWYSNVSLPGFWLTVTQTCSPPSHA